MTVEDLEVNRNVRSVLARNWVNLQKLDYACVHGTLYIRGRIWLLREPPPLGGEERDRHGVSASFLLYLEREILKVKGMRAVRWNIDGWQRTGMAWSSRG